VKPLLLAALLLPAVAHGADLGAIRDAICKWETRGERNPDKAPGAHGEIGRCQIKPGTAREAGFRGDLKDLWEPAINRAWALELLRQCRTKYGPRSEARLVWCYHKGPRARWQRKWRAGHYVNGVLRLYRLAMIGGR